MIRSTGGGEGSVDDELATIREGVVVKEKGVELARARARALGVKIKRSIAMTQFYQY